MKRSASCLNRNIGLLTLGLAILVASSCSAKYDLRLEQQGSAQVSLSATLSPRTVALIAGLSAFAQGGAGGRASSTSAPTTFRALDTASLSRTLKALSGVSKVDLRNTTPNSVSGGFFIADLERILISAPLTGGKPMTEIASVFKVERSASGGRISMNLSSASAPAFLAALSPEIRDYLEALMAPIAMGEKMGAADYLDLVELVYGPTIASELRTSVITVALELPAPAFNVHGGSSQGTRVDFSIPLVDILTLDKPISLAASWK